jgi:hypothetical protein
MIWLKSAANEFGRLAQGVGDRVKGTDTIHFIRKDKVPYERQKDATYASFTCDIRPHKDEKSKPDLLHEEIVSTTQTTWECPQ